MHLITAIAHKIGHNGGNRLEVSHKAHRHYGLSSKVLLFGVIRKAAIEDLVGGAIA
ncbi:MAG: hypothetical protein AAGA67_09675 [Cyanobacteria bacterium P01_F01_bin.153]